jgi:hypothetical protein
MHAGIEGCNRYRGMQRGRSGNAQQIKLFMISKIPPVWVPVLVRDAVRVPKILQRLSLHASQRYKINIGCGCVPGQVLLSRPTEPYDAGAEPIVAAHASTPSTMTRRLK